MPRLRTAERERTIGILMAGDRSNDIAHTFIVHPSIIYHLQYGFIVTGVTSDRPGSGNLA